MFYGCNMYADVIKFFSVFATVGPSSLRRMVGLKGLTSHLNVSLLHRAPESAPLKSKMIYASSKDAIKKKFTGERSGCLLESDNENMTHGHVQDYE